MKRWYLAPASLLYGMGTGIRNIMFNTRLKNSSQPSQPTIGVGNLSVGGTGKSPFVIYLANLLAKKHRTGVLSRGYGRKTKGYMVVNYDSFFKTVGDEAMQLFQRFKNKIVIAVCEDRVFGAQKLIKDMDLEVLILDDAYQHRYITPGLNILLTQYGDPYFKDFILPAGDLRETRFGARRADIIVVTKCPEDISPEKKEYFLARIKPKKHQHVFFASIDYDENIYRSDIDSEIPINNLHYYDILVVTGIANPKPLLQEIKKYAKKIKHLQFADHRDFSESDLQSIQKEYKKLGEYKLILTTEKDFSRLKFFEFMREKLYYWPINVEIDDENNFNQLVLDYVKHKK
jgi:tetraacyldisaccharide 4'-kinase